MSDLLFPKPEKVKKSPKRLVTRTPLRAKKKYVYKPKRAKATESIIQNDERCCYLCGSRGYGMDSLEEHHIFEGNGKRTLSEQYGLKVYLCGTKCHREGAKSAHRCKETKDMLHRVAQEEFEREHSREEFLLVFGKNYL